MSSMIGHTTIFTLLCPLGVLWLTQGAIRSTGALNTAGDQKFDKTTEVINSSYRFQFKTCTNSGRYGPTQYQCDRAYQFTDINITVITDAPYAGVQVWTVPKTALYSITALGASGGKGKDNSEASKGGYVSGKFNLTEGEQIYMLIGQQGRSACEEISDATETLCRYGLLDQKQEDLVKTGEDYSHMGGGAGGGGGTFVFKIDPETREPIPLVVAGGGGGQGSAKATNSINTDGGSVNGGDGYGANTAVNGAGGGGGWYGEAVHPQAGLSLLYGGTGGSPCHVATKTMGWKTNGGFGGGGGGCNAGGGGGGYSGGNVSLSDNPRHNGMGGSSYISPDADSALFEKGIQVGHGEVEIAYIFNCQCDFLCIYFNEETKRCYCPPNYLLAEDGITCLDINKVKRMSESKMISTTISSVIGIVILSALALLIVPCRNKCKIKGFHLKHLNNPDYQLGHLRNILMPRSMEYNPNYDFGGVKNSLKDLRQIPRQHLLLIRALGQGAFGEVYQGYLSNLPPEATDMQVAVKTLSVLSTDQTEKDFVIEALLMSMFDHPNIVKFVGVCFEKHPRYIILELLEGGDLKNFLRECRPKKDHPSPLTMLDLVNLSLDIAKGCQYLEQNHFVHRDIAARNCLLTKKGPGRMAKIADFGLARDIYRSDYYHKEGKAMLPVKWMPPEAFADGIFTPKTDVWSFGILLWEVFSLGYMPYPGRGNHEVMQLVTAGGRLDPPQNCPPAVHSLMKDCWHHVDEERPDFSTIVKRLQDIVAIKDLAEAPLPVLRISYSVKKYGVAMMSAFPDVTDSVHVMASDSNSFDEILRPLEAAANPQKKSPYYNMTQYLSSQLDGDKGRRPVTSGILAERSKRWNSSDANDEESNLLMGKEQTSADSAKEIPSGFSDAPEDKNTTQIKASEKLLPDCLDHRGSSSKISSKQPDDVRRWEQSDSGIEVDLKTGSVSL